jgi:hypothetical protein
MRLPEGFLYMGSQFVKLLKSLYGLKQAAHDWHQLQHKFLMGFDKRMKQSLVEPCLYYIIENDLIVLISVHVDDYLVATNSNEWYKNFFQKFSEKFEVNDLGIANHLLQIGIEWTQESVSMHQGRHIRELAATHGLTDSKPVYTPMESGLNLTPADEPDFSLPYRSLIGALLWITRGTRPDIYYSVIYLTKFNNSYGQQHYKAAKRILRYLITTIDKKLIYKKNLSSTPISVMSDSDWAGDRTDRLSYSGYLVRLFGNTVMWNTSKQGSPALSSCEAEYYALTEAAKETIHIYNLLKGIISDEGVKPIPIQMDNMGAGFMAEKDLNNKRTKHIDIRYHFIRHWVREKLVELFYVRTDENDSDLFTKALGTEKHNKFSKRIMEPS